MRYLILLICLLGVLIPVQAQTDFECDTGISYENAIRITLPDSRVDFENLPDDPAYIPGYFVGVMGLDETFPVLYQGGLDFLFCQPAPSIFYNANLPSAGEIATDEQVAQIYSVDPGSLEFAFANELSETGDYVFVLEGGDITPEDGDGDVFGISFDPAMTASVDIYVLATDDTYNPMISLLADDGSVLADNTDTELVCDDAGTDSCYGGIALPDDSYLTLQTTGETLAFTPQSAYLSVPAAVLETGNLQLQVGNNNGTGAYLLAMHITQQNPDDAPPIAQLTVTDATGAILRCDETFYEEAVILDITDASAEMPLQITVIGQDETVPIMAVLDDENRGICYEADAEDRFDYSLSLPDVEIIPPVSIVQATLTDPARIAISTEMFTGSRFALLLEGMTLTEEMSRQIYALQIPARTQITQPTVSAFMIALDSVLDPVLQLLDDADERLFLDGVGFGCDNAGFDEDCPPGTTDMSSALLQLSEMTLQALNIDTMLLFPYSENGQFRLESYGSESEDASTGTYLLVLYFIIP